MPDANRAFADFCETVRRIYDNVLSERRAAALPPAARISAEELQSSTPDPSEPATPSALATALDRYRRLGSRA